MKTLDVKIKNADKVAPVRATLSKMLEAQENGNIQAFAETFAHDQDMVNIGTDLDEVWYSWESFFNWMAPAISNRKGYSITEKETHITLSKNENVAWYSQLLDTCLETKGEPFNINGFRHTGVMEKRNDKWLIVQSHISIPFKNE